MYEETNTWLGLPKYFSDLHLEICSITGSHRIAQIKEDKNGLRISDKYKNIPQREWESAILNWAGFLEKGYVQITKDGNFVVAGKVKDKDKIKGLVEALGRLANELEETL